MTSPDEEKPFLHTPEIREVRNELFCFLDQTRVCGPSCMAFADPPEGKDYQQPFGVCVILANMVRIGKHMPPIARAAETFISRSRYESARQTQPSAPKVVP